MKCSVVRLLAALLTFTIGLITAQLCNVLRLSTATPTSHNNFNVSFTPINPQPTPTVEEQAASAPAQPKETLSIYEDICAPVDRLTYREYEVANVFRSDSNNSYTTIRKNGKLMAKLDSEYVGPYDEKGLRVGLFPLLGGKSKQLIVAQFSGGAHCCYSFWIYDLYPSFRLLFESEPYPIADYMSEAQFIDIDRDGVFEFEAANNSFAYFRSVFSGSSMPRIIFRYAKQARKYYPANQLFEARALDGIEEERKEIRELNRKKAAGEFPEREFPAMEYSFYTLDALLHYIYAGQEKEAWAFYDKEYKMEEFESSKSLRAEIKKILRKDAVYRYVYPHRMRPRN